MDCFDSVESKDKTHRVRSWYLYEQFKSLERNQLDAAQKLKDKSYQDKILLQELAERRARRKLYNQDELTCQSDSQLCRANSINNSAALRSSVDDFLDNLYVLHDDESSQGSDGTDTEEVYSQAESQTCRRYDECNSLDNAKLISCSESINSIIENIENSFENDKYRTKPDPFNFSKEIKRGLESVKEKVKYMEKLHISPYDLCIKDDYLSEIVSSCSIGDQDFDDRTQESDAKLYTLWSKLVSFAYHVIQLNHGNCYNDYSSQFLTAVLACDILRRGLGKMSNILQPYVLPITYATEQRSSSCLTLNDHNCMMNIKYHHPEAPAEIKKKFSKFKDISKSATNNCWCMEDQLKYYRCKCRTLRNYSSEPCNSVTKLSICNNNLSNKIFSSKGSPLSKEDLRTQRFVKVQNPMVKVERYFDKLLDETYDFRA